MSRCFPFPPPGYEKRTKIDDTDLLIKEKHKEKRHKDKKHKEKKEGKEKKDKEKSKERHREKKERNKKKKEQQKEKEGSKDKKGDSDGRRAEAGLPDLHKQQNPAKNTQQTVKARDSKHVQELSRRNGDEGRATGSHMVQNIILSDQRTAEILQRVVEGNVACQSAEKERNNKKEVHRRINGQKIQFQVQGLENTVNCTFSVVDQRRLDGSTMPVNKNHVQEQIDGNWKKEPGDNEIKGNIPKDRNWENKFREKIKDRDKEKEEKEKVMGNFEASNGKPKDGAKKSLETCTIKVPDVLEVGGRSSTGNGNLGKRKELGHNGCVHENGIRPNKLPRSVSSFHPVLENGRKPEFCQTASQFASEKPLVVHDHKLGIKAERLNGFVESQPNVSFPRPLSTNVHINGNGEASRRPPHRDSKYLSQIYSVPRMEDIAPVDFDDHQWLFVSSNTRGKVQTYAGC